jgi:hypothetical protein
MSLNNLHSGFPVFRFQLHKRPKGTDRSFEAGFIQAPDQFQKLALGPADGETVNNVKNFLHDETFDLILVLSHIIVYHN